MIYAHEGGRVTRTDSDFKAIIVIDGHVSPKNLVPFLHILESLRIRELGDQSIGIGSSEPLLGYLPVQATMLQVGRRIRNLHSRVSVRLRNNGWRGLRHAARVKCWSLGKGSPLRFGRLLRADAIDACPIPVELAFSCVVHAYLGGVAKGRQSHHHPADLLADFAWRSAEHIFYELVGFFLTAGVRLGELERFFKKSMISLSHVEVRGFWEARDNPLPHAVLKRVGLHLYSQKLI
ncbi:hypothetical protein H6M51_19970 [Rhizobium sp. AQ_MP]|uniref:hypothetical protein n=1 Tax=Rhizobium sp. AQ_MP TaxID=2761536 RepID=UPI001639610F|nr:hypothetical protein [Rhizobium sp. AQ_MP]MBC2775142.1 hypothetical protein [Rhizobium sp. AQ_MP]